MLGFRMTIGILSRIIVNKGIIEIQSTIAMMNKLLSYLSRIYILQDRRTPALNNGILPPRQVVIKEYKSNGSVTVDDEDQAAQDILVGIFTHILKVKVKSTFITKYKKRLTKWYRGAP